MLTYIRLSSDGMFSLSLKRFRTTSRPALPLSQRELHFREVRHVLSAPQQSGGHVEHDGGIRGAERRAHRGHRDDHRTLQDDRRQHQEEDLRHPGPPSAGGTGQDCLPAVAAPPAAVGIDYIDLI